MVSDIVTALLPIGVIRSLEIPKRQKNLLYLVFCVGLMYVLTDTTFLHKILTFISTCLISALRLIFIYPMTKNLDQTWHSPMFSIWSAVEINVAIFCSCAPTLKGLVQRVWPQFLASIDSRYGSGRGSGRGSSGREDSGATAVNSTNSTSSNDSLHKTKDISHVESQSPRKKSIGLLGFRRSLFKPFSSSTNRSLASCYGSQHNDDDVMFDDVGPRSSSRMGTATPTKGRYEEMNIEVQTIVDQHVEPRLVPMSEAHKTTVGTGPVTTDPFSDDQEEKNLQKAAWSS